MLQHLILDPTYGYLYPHRQAIAALGLANEYQLTKHRPRLLEGQHWHKIRGVDHVQRLFYSLPGLELLTQLIATPQAQAFWQALMQHTQPGGALVQVQPASLYTEPESHTPEAEPVPRIEATPNHPAAALAQYLSPELQRVVDRALAQPAVPAPRSDDTAALIFKAQAVLGEQIAKVQAAQPRPTITVWQRCDRWIATQDRLALLILYSFLILLTGFGSYVLIAASLQRSPSPADQPQAQPVRK